MSQEDEGASARSGASQAEAQASQAEAQATTLAAPGSDAILVEALRRGDENAFARLVDQYHPTLRRIARLYISKKAAVDEVVQDTWLAVIQGIWAFQGRSSVKTWIMRILINQAKTRHPRRPYGPVRGFGSRRSRFKR
ncbi:MAG TPA: RNA polymerase sigma factor [Acidobacteriota bacterium]|mgnify:CR=1 FL=1|nr:RNA polymerase sigma factor [Acidobacteriota bacterium]